MLRLKEQIDGKIEERNIEERNGENYLLVIEENTVYEIDLDCANCKGITEEYGWMGEVYNRKD